MFSIYRLHYLKKVTRKFSFEDVTHRGGIDGVYTNTYLYIVVNKENFSSWLIVCWPLVKDIQLQAQSISARLLFIWQTVNDDNEKIDVLKETFKLPAVVGTLFWVVIILMGVIRILALIVGKAVRRLFNHLYLRMWKPLENLNL